jgi:CheY-like chemotaxis protein
MKKDVTILVADDDDYDIQFLRRALAQAEVSNPLQVAQDGQVAIDYLSGTGPFADRHQFPLPSLLLLDLKMPRRTGLEVLTWIRSQDRFRGLPVIMLSSTVHPAEITEAYQRGVNAFVTKPTGTPERTELVRMIKGFWLTFTELP